MGETAPWATLGISLRSFIADVFDFKRTEGTDRWGNTFYSKLDVIAK